MVDAVRCAIEIQNGMVERNAGVAATGASSSASASISATWSRRPTATSWATASISPRGWKAVAEPGAICLSDDAYRQVNARLDLQSISARRQLKNIAEPVRVYSLQVRTAPRRNRHAASTPIRGGPSRLALPDKPSIAVLPFANMSGDAEQEYFADGISEDIITALSKLSQLFVIARNSSFTFKGKNVHIGEVGQEPRRALCRSKGACEIRRPGQDHRAA